MAAAPQPGQRPRSHPPSADHKNRPAKVHIIRDISKYYLICRAPGAGAAARARRPRSGIHAAGGGTRAPGCGRAVAGRGAVHICGKGAAVVAAPLRIGGPGVAGRYVRCVVRGVPCARRCRAPRCRYVRRPDSPRVRPAGCSIPARHPRCLPIPTRCPWCGRWPHAVPWLRHWSA